MQPNTIITLITAIATAIAVCVAVFAVYASRKPRAISNIEPSPEPVRRVDEVEEFLAQHFELRQRLDGAGSGGDLAR